MIELRSLHKKFVNTQGEAFTALRDVSLDVPSGSICGVIGRSGAGKSTLIRCVNLLERPDSGEVRVAGQSLLTLSAKDLRAARREIGMVFQHFNLLSTKTVAQNISLPLLLAGYDVEARDARVSELLRLTQLTDKAHSYPAQLSGGQKQRVAIARALATQPEVLLCDEMTSALDPESTRQVLQLLRDIQQELSLTVLLITHEMDVIKQIADKVVVMDGGEIIEQGSVSEVFAKPQQLVTRQLVDSTEHMVLPSQIVDCMQVEPVTPAVVILELSFSGEVTAKPLISACVERFGVEVNILQANLSHLRDVLVGKMLLGCAVNGTSAQTVCEFLQQSGITVEVLGYVKRDRWPFHSSHR